MDLRETYLSKISMYSYQEYLDAKKEGLVIYEQFLDDNGYLYVKKLDNGFGIRVSYDFDYKNTVIEICNSYFNRGSENYLLINGNNKDVINYYLQNGFSMMYPSFNMELIKSEFVYKEETIDLIPYNLKDNEKYLELLGNAFTPIRKQLNLEPYNWHMNNQEECTKGFIESASKNQLFGYYAKNELIGVLEIVKNDIETIAIRNDYQGRGLGVNLLQKTINDIFNKGYDKAVLAVLGGNEKATNLYEKLNFRIKSHQVILKQIKEKTNE